MGRRIAASVRKLRSETALRIIVAIRAKVAEAV
jgi:hypothetical protein